MDTKTEAIEELKQKTNDLKEILMTCRSAGWKYLSEWITQKIEYNKNFLLVCPLDKVYEARASVKAYTDLLNIPTDITNLINTNETILREGGNETQ